MPEHELTPDEKVIAAAIDLIFVPRLLPLLAQFLVEHDKQVIYMRDYYHMTGHMPPNANEMVQCLEISPATIALAKSLAITFAGK